MTRRRGYTLVEIAFGVAVGAVLMLGIMQLLRGAIAAGGRQNEAQGALQSATMISEVLHRDLRYMVVPIVAPPSRTEAAGTGSGTGTTSAPPSPSSTEPTGEEAEPDVLNPENYETLRPFRRWNTAERRPEVDEGVWIDLTDPAKTPSGGDYHPNVFMFYRTRVGGEAGGLFGVGGQKAGYVFERVWYRAVLSKKFADQGVYVLRRDVEEVRIEVNDGPGGHSERVLPAFDPNKETAEGKLYKAFYFKRLVISLHQAPEVGLAQGAAPGPALPPAGALAGADSPPPLDTLYFARLLIAGAAAGAGTRRIELENGKETDRSQKLDLVVNLLHLDGVSDRFRKRSLAMNWNLEMPTPSP